MDIDTRLSDREMEPFNVGLRQAHVERGNTSGSKGRRSCGKCNDEIKCRNNKDRPEHRSRRLDAALRSGL